MKAVLLCSLVFFLLFAELSLAYGPDAGLDKVRLGITALMVAGIVGFVAAIKKMRGIFALLAPLLLLPSAAFAYGGAAEPQNAVALSVSIATLAGVGGLFAFLKRERMSMKRFTLRFEHIKEKLGDEDEE